MTLDRRRFCSLTAGALLAAPVLARAQDEPERRRLFDAVTGAPLPGIKLTFKRIGAQGNWKFRTDSDGSFAFGEIAAALEQPAPVRIRLSTANLRKKYIGIDLTIIVDPDMRGNEGVGDLGVIPLKSPGASAGLPDSGFNSAWMDLIWELFFSIDRQEKRPKGTMQGALRAFAVRDLRVRLSSKFSATEFDFLANEIDSSLRQLSGNSLLAKGFLKVNYGNIPDDPARVPAGYLMFAKRDDFSRPAVRIRYGDSMPDGEAPDATANPHEISGGLIILDTYTLGSLYRNGNGSAEEQERARAILQRCIADATGWRPTIRLPQLSVVDENYGPPETLVRAVDSIYDEALGLAVSGGGSRCYPPGTRFVSTKNVVQLKNDPDFPLNMQALT